MTSQAATFLFGLYEARQAMQPLISQLLARLDETMLSWARATAFAQRNAPGLISPLPDQVITVEDRIFAAWVLYYLNEHCYLNKTGYVEYVFADLFCADAAFLNGARVECGWQLAPLYWVCSPSILDHDFPIRLSIRGTRLYVEGHLAPLATVPSWTYRSGHPQE